MRELYSLLEHRPPFLFLDRLIELEHGVYAKGVKNISINEPFFSGHFPRQPIMPGALIMEAAAQLCAVVMAKAEEEPDKLPVLIKVEMMKFLKPVVPGDRLVLEARLLSHTLSLSKFSVEGLVEGNKVTSGILVFSYI
ncbi:3-hydroxyacyl-ACP dehydratase FabZ [Paenibacillus tritici]|uniref:3-hydroxyacyl-ACP dehydratase FabZ n=1 Tax=Paenibacillus tritici TaxID=1873425 RepID=UPI001BA68964|nr:3-hydroxyacyl-ACP dehydratase FabZ [Paenibacillus tritici]QUL55900.1 3-hydroxyacyl-ACP dehydratase FabZ [Paenibacillus tritici]